MPRDSSRIGVTFAPLSLELFAIREAEKRLGRYLTRRELTNVRHGRTSNELDDDLKAALANAWPELDKAVKDGIAKVTYSSSH